MTSYIHDFLLQCYDCLHFIFYLQAFRLGSPLVHNLSNAILSLEGENVDGLKIEAKWFGTASPRMGASTVTDTDSAPLTLQSFAGLFVITGSVSTLMLLISIVRLAYTKCTELRRANVESVSHNDVGDDSRPLQNGMCDDPSPEQPSLHETDTSDSHGVHGSSQNAGDEDPSPVPCNGIHSGSVSAEHVQIEMSTA